MYFSCIFSFQSLAKYSICSCTAWIIFHLFLKCKKYICGCLRGYTKHVCSYATHTATFAPVAQRMFIPRYDCVFHYHASSSCKCISVPSEELSFWFSKNLLIYILCMAWHVTLMKWCQSWDVSHVNARACLHTKKGIIMLIQQAYWCMYERWHGFA